MNKAATSNGYQCQFCGEVSARREWKNKGQTCPKCGRDHDPLLAQDAP